MKGIIKISVSVNIDPIHKNVFNKHITVIFKADQDETADLVGKEATVKLISHHKDEKGQAVKVEIPEWLKKLSNREPHITISCAEGTKPMYSNDLIKSVGEPIEGEAKGVVEFQNL